MFLMSDKGVMLFRISLSATLGHVRGTSVLLDAPNLPNGQDPKAVPFWVLRGWLGSIGTLIAVLRTTEIPPRHIRLQRILWSATCSRVPTLLISFDFEGRLLWRLKPKGKKIGLYPSEGSEISCDIEVFLLVSQHSGRQWLPILDSSSVFDTMICVRQAANMEGN